MIEGMENQRVSERIPIPFTIEQLVKHRSDYPRLSAEDEYLSVRGLNLSSGGLSAESVDLIEPLSRVFVMFTLPGAGGDRRIRCEGFVAHSRWDGSRCVFGISFRDLSADDRAAIDATLRPLMPPAADI
jgi:hypothetical protein